MTRSADGETVRLSAGNWIALLLAIGGGAITNFVTFRADIDVLKSTMAAHEKRLDQGDARDVDTLRIIREEFATLRKELREEIRSR